MIVVVHKRLTMNTYYTLSNKGDDMQSPFIWEYASRDIKRSFLFLLVLIEKYNEKFTHSYTKTSVQNNNKISLAHTTCRKQTRVALIRFSDFFPFLFTLCNIYAIMFSFKTAVRNEMTLVI